MPNRQSLALLCSVFLLATTRVPGFVLKEGSGFVLSSAQCHFPVGAELKGVSIGLHLEAAPKRLVLIQYNYTNAAVHFAGLVDKYSIFDFRTITGTVARIHVPVTRQGGFQGAVIPAQTCSVVSELSLREPLGSYPGNYLVSARYPRLNEPAGPGALGPFIGYMVSNSITVSYP